MRARLGGEREGENLMVSERGKGTVVQQNQERERRKIKPGFGVLFTNEGVCTPYYF